jgi:hypothetical protein
MPRHRMKNRAVEELAFTTAERKRLLRGQREHHPPPSSAVPPPAWGQRGAVVHADNRDRGAGLLVPPILCVEKPRGREGGPQSPAKALSRGLSLLQSRHQAGQKKEKGEKGKAR